jgi:putative transcription antitermination factor YqgF
VTTGSKVLALDYGRARTGVAVSDETGVLARPLGVVERASTERGLAEVCAIIERERADLVLVGLPLTLRGEHGAQADETSAFVARLKRRCPIPIRTQDERFTTSIARRTRPTGHREAPDDPEAATVLLQGFLDARAARG